jgi:hypothetical protein
VPPVSGNDSIPSTGGVQQILPIVLETMTVMTDGPELDTIPTSLVSFIEQTVKTATEKGIQTHTRRIMGQEPILSSAIQSQNEETIQVLGIMGQEPIPLNPNIQSGNDATIASQSLPNSLGANLSVVSDTQLLPIPITSSLPLDISVPQSLKTKFGLMDMWNFLIY